jgi:hypothetical protein
MWQKSMRETPRAESRSRGSAWNARRRDQGLVVAHRRADRHGDAALTGGQEGDGFAFGPRRLDGDLHVRPFRCGRGDGLGPNAATGRAVEARLAA